MRRRWLSSFFGLTAFLVPVFLFVAGWRRLRRHGAARVVGRGFGVALLLAATPALLQLTLGRIELAGRVAGGRRRLRPAPRRSSR